MKDWYELTLEERIDRLAQSVCSLERILDANNIEYPEQQILGYTILNVKPKNDALSLDRRYGVYNSDFAKRAKSSTQEEQR